MNVLGKKAFLFFRWRINVEKILVTVVEEGAAFTFNQAAGEF